MPETTSQPNQLPPGKGGQINKTDFFDSIDPSSTFDASPFQSFCTFRSPDLSARSHRHNGDELAAVNLHGPGERVAETAEEID